MSARVPTEPGWWWRFRQGEAVVVRVEIDHEDDTLSWWLTGPSDNGAHPIIADGRWIAPVATPEQVAALVAAGDALEEAVSHDVTRLVTEHAPPDIEVAWFAASAPFRVPS